MNDGSELALKLGRIYPADSLDSLSGFSPYYLRASSGIVPARNKSYLLLTTPADQEASFGYGDYWHGEALIYTGRGQDDHAGYRTQSDSLRVGATS